MIITQPGRNIERAREWVITHQTEWEAFRERHPSLALVNLGASTRGEGTITARGYTSDPQAPVRAEAFITERNPPRGQYQIAINVVSPEEYAALEVRKD